MQIQTKIFIGYSIDKPMRLHLEKSARWKEEKFTSSEALIEISYRGHAYIGAYLPNDANFLEIEKKNEEVRSLLQHYCPKLMLDKQNAFLFPQIFIG